MAQRSQRGAGCSPKALPSGGAVCKSCWLLLYLSAHHTTLVPIENLHGKAHGPQLLLVTFTRRGRWRGYSVMGFARLAHPHALVPTGPSVPSAFLYQNCPSGMRWAHLPPSCGEGLQGGLRTQLGNEEGVREMQMG